MVQGKRFPAVPIESEKPVCYDVQTSKKQCR